jgi:predicted 3-demethylubiquinone-9 3-methyltransferase (glyoxalase superfamily)
LFRLNRPNDSERRNHEHQAQNHPCLWFNFNAEETVNHYLSIFKRSKILEVSRYGDAMPELKGKVLMMRFELEGQQFQALNAGPQFPFTEAISLSVDCADQTEVDALWARLKAAALAVRLAERQVRTVLADRAARTRDHAKRLRSQQGSARDASHDDDEQD